MIRKAMVATSLVVCAVSAVESPYCARLNSNVARASNSLCNLHRALSRTNSMEGAKIVWWNHHPYTVVSNTSTGVLCTDGKRRVVVQWNTMDETTLASINRAAAMQRIPALRLALSNALYDYVRARCLEEKGFEWYQNRWMATNDAAEMRMKQQRDDERRAIQYYREKNERELKEHYAELERQRLASWGDDVKKCCPFGLRLGMKETEVYDALKKQIKFSTDFGCDAIKDVQSDGQFIVTAFVHDDGVVAICGVFKKIDETRMESIVETMDEKYVRIDCEANMFMETLAKYSYRISQNIVALVWTEPNILDDTFDVSVIYMHPGKCRAMDAAQKTNIKRSLHNNL